MEQAVAAFKGQFTTFEGKSLVNEPEVEAMEAGTEGQEKITRYSAPKK